MRRSKPQTETARFNVKVRPAARENRFDGERAGALRVSVAAPPDKGKANEALVRLIATRLGVTRASVSIVAGASSRDKVVEVAGMARDEVLRRLLE